MTAPSYIADEAAKAVVAIADELATPIAREMAAEAVALVHTPATLGARLVAAVAEITDAGRLASLADTGATLPAVPDTTSWRRVQAKNQEALTELVRGAATVALARRSAIEDYIDRQAATERRREVSDRLDDRSAYADTPTFTAFRRLRAAVSAHVAREVEALPRVTTATPTAVRPSLALSYAIYGDVSRAGEIAARNRLPRPGFVPARPLELVE